MYVFHAQGDRLPLYIGKSIIYATFAVHLRNPDEARMLRQATHITHIRTAGEIGALLLEAQMIKQQQPLFNQKLRRNRQLCAWQLVDGIPAVVYSRDIDFAQAPNLYGLYSSRTSAVAALQALADAHRLCHGALGLERLVAGKACFRSMLKRCNGLCCGKESAADHAQRLHTALQGLRIATWPYPGAIGLENLRICSKSTSCTTGAIWAAAPRLPKLKLGKVAAGFDADGYKILCRPILAEELPIVPLQRCAGRAEPRS